MRAPSVLAGLALIAVFLTACGRDDQPDSKIPAAVESCDPAAEGRAVDGITYAYSDTNVTARSPHPSMEAQVAMLAVVGCLVDALDGPKSIGERYLNSAGGGGSESWDNYEANWSIGNSAQFSIDAK